MESILETAGTPRAGETSLAGVYSKVTWRIVPLLFVCYVLAYLDRINVGFAQLQMKSDLGFSDAVYGLGAGIFFVGYFLFEVPSNLLLKKIGARKTITRIMVIWGLISASMAFVHEPWAFYLLRFLLGVFEAGFFPGIILYITFWYTGAYRGRIIAIFSSAFAVAGVLGGPISGWIMNDLAGTLGLKGWQWMFILEGLPTLLVGIVVFSYLDDGPAAAKWLTGEERKLISQSLAAESSAAGDIHKQHLTSFRTALTDGRLYVLAFSWFCFICGIYMISFWLPTLIKELGVSSPLHVGLLVSIPFGLSVIGMIAMGIHSDRTLERRWHCALPAFVGALALIGLVFSSGNTATSFVLLCIAAIGINATVPLFWSIPTAYLKGEAAAGGIALVNSLGLIGGFVSPFVLGWIRTSTGSFLIGNWLIAALLIAGALAILLAVRPDLLREARANA